MQSWTSKGSRCLFCALRPVFRPVQRSFSTSPLLEKARKSQKAKQDKAEAAEESLKKSSSKKKSLARRPLSRPFAIRDFVSIVESELGVFKQSLQEASDPALAGWERFERYVMNACKLEDRSSHKAFGPLRHVKTTLQKAYLSSGISGLRSELRYLMHAEEITEKYSAPRLEQQKKIADLRYPAEWYPQARALQRTIHLHVGPTNSGKTYHALQRLQASKNGFYAGPLRLLAQEVYHRFKASGIPCSLVTGDDVKIPEGQTPTIVSNTVEMVSLGQPYEVGVIDEIQMLADPKRGWAWTRAVLGARAKELHLCGETRVVPLIRELAALTGDRLEIHRYKRLNPLKVMDESIRGDLKNLQKGDCLVAFSRVGIHALKADIEKVTGRRAAIVYGSLPAEIRMQQASLFNDPDNDYDFLVASDAIGMGLNLSIKRIIFETLVKRVPGGLVRLTIPEIKQIGGRAGRYRSAAQQDKKDTSEAESNIGLVTALEEVDLPYIREAMESEPPPLTAAGIFPPDPVFQKFSAYFPQSVPFEYLIKRLMEVSEVNPLFFLCDPRGQLENAEVIDSVPGLPIEDQVTFMAAPMYTRDKKSRNVACAFAECVAEHSAGGLLDIPDLNLEILEQPVSGNKEYLHELEGLHRSVILYSWLSYRFGGIFTDRTLAAHVKEMVEERMVRALTEFSANKKLRKDASLRRQIALQKQLAEQKRVLEEANIEFEDGGNGERVPVDVSAEDGSLEQEGDESYDPFGEGRDGDTIPVDVSAEDSPLERAAPAARGV